MNEEKKPAFFLSLLLTCSLPFFFACTAASYYGGFFFGVARSTLGFSHVQTFDDIANFFLTTNDTANKKKPHSFGHGTAKLFTQVLKKKQVVFSLLTADFTT